MDGGRSRDPTEIPEYEIRLQVVSMDGGERLASLSKI